MGRKLRLGEENAGRFRPGRAEYTVWDSGIAGFGVRVRPSGSRTFVFHCGAHGRSKRFTLGRVGVKPIGEARRECLEIRLREAAGGSPDATDRNPVPSFRDFVLGDWTEACRGRHKPSTKKSIDSHLKTQLLPAFGSTPLDRISRAAVIGWFSRTSPGGANRALDTLSRIMNHALVCGHVPANPARGVKRNPGRRMTRFLSRDEIRLLHETLDACVAERPSRGPRADIVRLLLLTGCRSGEIRTLQWREVGEHVLALSDSKTGPRTVYLNRDAKALIARQLRMDSAYVFRSVRDPGRPCSERSLWNFWYMARERAGLEDLRLHDLRHTHASQAVMKASRCPWSPNCWGTATQA
ncbi:MAG: tyrosine-type recombinase/integrase [Alphaproteobacteria bacterium]|nr:tyrosine-type recombinase/integrase [Alphaproteobacteria bacterium]